MPILRCPSCYYATTVRKDSVEGVSCEKCGTNLFDYYYKGRSASEASLLITEKGAEFKRKKAKSERERNKVASETLKQSSEGHSRSMRNVMSNKESLTENVVGYVIAGTILLSIYGGFQYFQLRSGVQESTIEILNDNGYPGYKADGIALPLSAAFGGITTAKVFLKNNGGTTQAIEVEVTQKGIPILSVFTGSEYLTEISGVELMQLR